MSTEAEIESFLEHYGKKGMRWGKRGTARVQKRIDSVSRVATGQASARDRLRTGLLVTKKSAAKSLEKGAKLQSKVNSGKAKTTNLLTTLNGVKIKNLDFKQTSGSSYKTAGNNKGDTGRRVAIGLISAGLMANTVRQITR